MFKEYCFMDTIRNPLCLDCHPSLKEVEDAFEVLCQVIAYYSNRTELPEDDPGYASPERVARAAAAEIWRAGRIFQRNKDAKALMV